MTVAVTVSAVSWRGLLGETVRASLAPARAGTPKGPGPRWARLARHFFLTVKVSEAFDFACVDDPP